MKDIMDWTNRDHQKYWESFLRFKMDQETNPHTFMVTARREPPLVPVPEQTQMSSPYDEKFRRPNLETDRVSQSFATIT
jgi:hypothetical protein